LPALREFGRESERASKPTKALSYESLGENDDSSKSAIIP